MSKKVMICGVDCHPGDKHCNGYCTGRTDNPPDATPEMIINAAAMAAHRALDAATKAWYEYAGLIDVGTDRTWAFGVHENLHRARSKA